MRQPIDPVCHLVCVCVCRPPPLSVRLFVVSTSRLACVQGLLIRLQEVEARISAAVSTEEAGQMADRYAAAAREGRGAPQGEAGGRAGGGSEEKITRIVEVITAVHIVAEESFSNSRLPSRNPAVVN